MRRAPHLASLSLVALLVSTAVHAQSKVYFGEYAFQDGRLMSMDLDGSNPLPLFQTPIAEWLPIGIGFDPVAQKIYWTDGLFTTGTIRRANLDGSGLELLQSNIRIGRGLALDLVNGEMYWATAPLGATAMGLVDRAKLDGTVHQIFYTLAPYDPDFSFVGHPLVDPVNDYVYFFADGEIRRKRIGGYTTETVVRGLNTVTALALDVAHNHIYFIDANTNTDFLGRANLDDTDFTVLVDMTPGGNQSSGLIGMTADLNAGKLYWTNELLGNTVEWANLDGTGRQAIHSDPTRSPTAITLDVIPPQAIADCNHNGQRDLEDIQFGRSRDCNSNSIPDECEGVGNPCHPHLYAVDNGSNPGSNVEYTLSGSAFQRFEVFQPFDVAQTTDFFRIALDGWTWIYHSAGLRATLFPDDGTGTFPDESAPIDSADIQFRFSPNTSAWREGDIRFTGGPGRYWVRLRALGAVYDGRVNFGTSGLAAKSRRGDGAIFQGTNPIALRLEGGPPPLGVTVGSSAGIALRAPNPNPMPGRGAFEYVLDRGAEVDLAIFDVAGRRVRTIERGRVEGGAHRIAWDGADEVGRAVGNGVYFIRLRLASTEPMGSRAIAQRFTVMK